MSMRMKTFIALTLILIVCCIAKPEIMGAEDKGVVAVLPLQIHAMEKPDQAKKLQEMITLEMEKRGFRTISPRVVNKHPKAFSPGESLQVAVDNVDLRDLCILRDSIPIRRQPWLGAPRGRLTFRDG